MRWVIGDVHGMLRPLQAILDEIARRDLSARLMFVGDYVNRGPDSRGVIDLLLGLKNATFVRGNHDDVFQMLLTGQSYAPHLQAGDPVSAFMWFINYGLEKTLASYEVDYLDVEWVRHHPTPNAVLKLFSAVPESHRQFIVSLVPVIEEPDIFVAHAMWAGDESDDSPSIGQRLADDVVARHRILWGRFGPEVSQRKFWRRTGYFGHTPIEFYPSLHGGRNQPIRLPDTVLLDTGAALGPAGRLSAVCPDSGEVIQMDRAGKLVVERERANDQVG
jgi:hypothetical protein